MKLLTQTPYVAIMLRTSAKTYREVLHGILQHVRTATPWAIRVDMSSEKKSEQARLGYKEEKFSGVVIDETNDLFPKLDTFGSVPIVTIESVRPPAHLPKNRIYLYCDNNAIGNMAASFLISKGFKSFGYVNHALGLAWSIERGKAFASALRKAGFPCAIYNSPNPKTPDVIVQDRLFLAKWLRELPKPIALFAANDIRSLDVLDACRQEKISVPGDIALLSCDDDELLCETANPSLSSIRFSTVDAGHRAAEILDRLIRGSRSLPRKERLVPYGPMSVTERLSSESVKRNDPLVESALSLIRLNAFSGLHVQKLAQKLKVSRRTLETRFRSATGRSIYDELLRIRFDSVCKHLREGKLTIADIAERCGFPDASHLGVMFKRRFGMTPSEYRNGR